MDTVTNTLNEKMDLGSVAMEEFFLPICLLGTDGAIEYVNKAFSQSLGFSKAELTTVSIFDVCPMLDPAQWKQLVDKLMEEQVIVTTSIFRYKDARPVPAELRLSGLEADGATYIHMVLTSLGEKVDVKAASSFEAILNSFPDMLFVLDNSGTILDFKAGRRTLRSNLPTKLLGKKIQEIVQSAIGVKLSDAIKAAVAEGKMQYLEYMQEQKGREQWFEAGIMPIDNHLLAIIRDVSNRKRAKEEELVQQSTFKTLFDHSHQFICLIHPDGRLREVNKAMLKLSGLNDQSELEGKFFWECPIWQSADVDEKELHASFAEAAAGRSKGLEFSLNKGEKLAIELCFTPIFNSHGEVELVLSEGRDISGLKYTEEKLRKSEYLYRTLARHIPNACLYLFDKDLRYTIVEGKAVEELGSPKTEMEGKTLFEVYPKDKIDFFLPLYQAALKGRTSSTEYRGFNGHRFEMSFIPVINAENEIEGGIVAAFDVEKAKRVESELESKVMQLRQSESLYRTLAHSIPKGVIFLFDKDLRFTLAEGEALPMLKLAKADVEGKTFDEVYSKETRDKFLPAFRGALEGNISIIEHQEASGHWFQWSILPFEDVGSEMEGGMMVGYNIDEIKRAEGERDKKLDELKYTNNQLKIENGVRQLIEKNLQEYAEELKAKNEELEQFAYVASHDLQEPLRMVSSYTQLLAKRYNNQLDDDANEFIRYAIEGATRMQSLINDLLVYSRVGNKEMSFEKINLGVVMQLVTKNLALLINETKTCITYDDMPFVQADASQLVQLFQNLVSNAIKFRKPDMAPSIVITSKSQGKYWCVNIKDNGIGLGMEYKDRIFQIFQRLHTRDKYEGTGIGLAICKKIVERHGGQIWVESQKGRGTTFCFTLPK